MSEADRPRPQIILCADDFGLSPGVSAGILELLGAGRLSATGAMTNLPSWGAGARALAPFASRADLGLHFNLTCGPPLTPMPTLAPQGDLPPLRKVAAAALRESAARAEITQELTRQLQAFEEAMGRAPDFVDGHQHVHALPAVRDIVIRTVAARYPVGSVYLRDPADRMGAILRRGVAVTKALTVAGLARGFAAAARQAGLPVNQGFSGFSPFDATRDTGADFARFLVDAGPCHLIMCHPGHVDEELRWRDAVLASREAEWRWLMQGQLTDMAKLARFREITTMSNYSLSKQL